MKTPIQKLKEKLLELSYSPEHNYSVFTSIEEMKKYEREFAHKCFTSGASFGIDLYASSEWGEHSTVPDFEEFYKKYEKC